MNSAVLDGRRVWFDSFTHILQAAGSSVLLMVHIALVWQAGLTQSIGVVGISFAKAHRHHCPAPLQLQIPAVDVFSSLLALRSLHLRSAVWLLEKLGVVSSSYGWVDGNDNGRARYAVFATCQGLDIASP